MCLIILKFSENNGTEEIGVVTPTPDVRGRVRETRWPVSVLRLFSHYRGFRWTQLHFISPAGLNAILQTARGRVWESRWPVSVLRLFIHYRGFRWTQLHFISPAGLNAILQTARGRVHGWWTSFRRNGVRNDLCDWFATISGAGLRRKSAT